MSDPIEKILSDLPTIRRIARKPLEDSPLLSIVLQQARALEEIATWAGNAERLGRQRSIHAVPSAPEVMPDGAEDVAAMESEPAPGVKRA